MSRAHSVSQHCVNTIQKMHQHHRTASTTPWSGSQKFEIQILQFKIRVTLGLGFQHHHHHNLPLDNKLSISWPVDPLFLYEAHWHVHISGGFHAVLTEAGPGQPPCRSAALTYITVADEYGYTIVSFDLVEAIPCRSQPSLEGPTGGWVPASSSGGAVETTARKLCTCWYKRVQPIRSASQEIACAADDRTDSTSITMFMFLVFFSFFFQP